MSNDFTSGSIQPDGQPSTGDAAPISSPIEAGPSTAPESQAAPDGMAAENNAADQMSAESVAPASAGSADQSAEPVAAASPKPPKPPKSSFKPAVDPPDEPAKMDWYILKVQSNREDSIRDALQRRIAMQGLQQHFGEIIVPVEMVSEFKNGRKRVVKRKLYPGYLVVRMEINDDTWFLVRETPGIGDFTGSGGKPSPMLPHEVAKILAKQEEHTDEAPKLNIRFNKGDHVKIREGTFENFEGDVEAIDEANGRVTVMINIFGRSTPVELEHWQIESI